MKKLLALSVLFAFLLTFSFPVAASGASAAYQRMKDAIEAAYATEAPTEAPAPQLTTLEQWVKDTTGFTDEPGTRDIGDIDVGYIVFFQPYVIEFGAGPGQQPLRRYYCMNQLDFSAEGPDVPPLSFSERFALAGSLLEFARTHAANLIADLFLQSGSLDDYDVAQIFIGLSNDEGDTNYFIKYNFFTGDYDFYTMPSTD